MNTSLIHQPKKIIAIVAVVALVAGFFLYRSIGNAPHVVLPDSQNSAGQASGATIVTQSSDTSYDLAFPQAGRVASVAVKVGEHVVKGQLLASLDAGSAAGAVTQAKGALELAQAQYASTDVQYANAKKQQDVLVQNAFRTLLSNGLAAVPTVQDDSHIPTISGTYTCQNQGTYEIDPYPSGSNSGFSFTYSGLEKGGGEVTFNTPQPLGTCGLYIQFAPNFSGATKWTVSIPNAKSNTYAANKNAYDLAVTTRDQVLSQYAANLGQNGSQSANTAKAAVDAAQGVYQAALGAFQNTQVVAPVTGTVTFVDTDLKVGQSVTQGKAVISISTQ